MSTHTILLLAGFEFYTISIFLLMFMDLHLFTYIRLANIDMDILSLHPVPETHKQYPESEPHFCLSPYQIDSRVDYLSNRDSYLLTSFDRVTLSSIN